MPTAMKSTSSHDLMPLSTLVGHFVVVASLLILTNIFIFIFDRSFVFYSDPKMNRIRKEYLDPRSPKNVQKLSSDLNDIHNIMISNIQEVLRRGEKLERKIACLFLLFVCFYCLFLTRLLEGMHEMSSTLSSESKRFEKISKYINFQYLLRTFGPLVVVLLVIVFVLYWKFF